MSFDYPLVLISFIIFIPIFIFDIINRRKKVKLSLEKKLRLSSLFFRLFLVFAITAAAGPKWGISYSPSEYYRGLDIVFAIDISRSMDIRDAQNNNTRLECGLLILQETISSVSGARFAAAIGRGRGYLAIPLTYDSEAAFVFLESINSSSMTGRSTNLESLVDAASGAFQNTSAARRIIVLVSDGESHAGVLRNALARCAKEGIIVSSIAVGSDDGRQIQILADSPDAQFAVSRRDTAVMRSAAERTGGIYIDGNREDAGSALSSWFLSMTDLSQIISDQTSIKKTEPKQRRTLFIILAIIAYAVSKFVTRSFRLPLVSLISILILLSSCDKLLLLEANYLSSRGRHEEAAELYLKALNHEDTSAYAEYGLGLTFYLLDDSETAKRRYDNSQKMLESYSNNEHRELRYRNYYNTGIIMFEEGDFHSAAAAFREALRTDSKRTEAKRNLELSLMSISMEANTQNRTEDRQEQREILFEYLRLEEQQKWRSREWAPEEIYTDLDY